MMRRGGPGDGTPSLESLRELRLGALLRGLVNDLGPGRRRSSLALTARLCGGGRSRRCCRRAWLRRWSGCSWSGRWRRPGRTASGSGRWRNGLPGWSGSWRRRWRQVMEAAATVAAWGAQWPTRCRQEFAQEIQRLERRLDRPGVGRGATDAVTGGSRAGRTGAQRRYDELVTREPADDDEPVYGSAWPLVDEWRRLWDSHSPTGRGLAWVSARERILELEVAMLEEHGLTLPQETAPLRGLDRGEQLNWRVRELAGFRQRRARLELLRWARRVLTLGLWPR